MKILKPFLTALNSNFLREIELLLIALNVPYSIENGTIYIYEEDAFFVYNNLNEYLKEELEVEDKQVEDEDMEIVFSNCMVLFLIVFYFITKLTDFNFWIAAGANDAAKVINGEFYRAITALTLHANIAHIASNMIFFLILIKSVVKYFNEGKAWFFIILSGFLANVVSDYIYQKFHSSIGFSTSVFAVIGMLSFQNFIIKNQNSSIIKKYLPISAGIALLAFTGTGKNVDLIAHIAGFFSGIVVLMLYYKKFPFFDSIKERTYKFIVVFTILFSWLLAIMFSLN